MNILKSLISYFSKNTEAPSSEAPDGLCPNCWGREEYGGQFYEAVKKNGIDINSKDKNLGWVQEYANKHLLDIRMEDGNCKKCKLSYKSV